MSPREKAHELITELYTAERNYSVRYYLIKGGFGIPETVIAPLRERWEGLLAQLNEFGIRAEGHDEAKAQFQRLFPDPSVKQTTHKENNPIKEKPKPYYWHIDYYQQLRERFERVRSLRYGNHLDWPESIHELVSHLDGTRRRKGDITRNGGLSMLLRRRYSDRLQEERMLAGRRERVVRKKKYEEQETIDRKLSKLRHELDDLAAALRAIGENIDTLNEEEQHYGAKKSIRKIAKLKQLTDAYKAHGFDDLAETAVALHQQELAGPLQYDPGADRYRDQTEWPADMVVS